MTKNVMDSTEVADETVEPVVASVDSTGEDLIKRQEVADILGVTVSEVRRRERIGTLRPKRRDSRGVWLFDRGEVEEQRKPKGASRLTRKSADPFTPEEAKAVFDALDAGKTLVQCVCECLILPTTVELIATAYARLSGGMYVRKEAMDAINVMPLEGTFPLKADTDLVAVLKTASADTCKKCNTRARVYCKPCAFKAAERVKDGL
jgi:hypothetical protein